MFVFRIPLDDKSLKKTLILLFFEELKRRHVVKAAIAYVIVAWLILQISDVVSPPSRASVAVLPFVNMSGNPENEYFSDGLSEELLNVLATVSSLKVAARTSSFHFKGHTGDIADIARRLGVGSVLEGSVRQSGARIRITTQLNNAQDGYH